VDSKLQVQLEEGGGCRTTQSCIDTTGLWLNAPQRISYRPVVSEVHAFQLL